MRQDLQNLKRLLFSKQQRWLFKHNGDSYIKLKETNDESQEIDSGGDKTWNDGMQTLHGWVCKSPLDRMLVKKVFKVDCVHSVLLILLLARVLILYLN